MTNAERVEWYWHILAGIIIGFTLGNWYSDKMHDRAMAKETPRYGKCLTNFRHKGWTEYDADIIDCWVISDGEKEAGL